MVTTFIWSHTLIELSYPTLAIFDLLCGEIATFYTCAECATSLEKRIFLFLRWKTMTCPFFNWSKNVSTFKGIILTIPCGDTLIISLASLCEAFHSFNAPTFTLEVMNSPLTLSTHEKALMSLFSVSNFRMTRDSSIEARFIVWFSW